jgi:hypothetical protein
MRQDQFRTVLVYATLAIVIAVAKRIPPKPVAPIIANGIEYSAEGDGKDQYVAATDTSSGKQLWKVKVFHTHTKFWVEEDVQWVFITNLKVADKSLLVRDERARCYSVDLQSRRVRTASCGTSFSQQQAVPQ